MPSRKGNAPCRFPVWCSIMASPPPARFIVILPLPRHSQDSGSHAGCAGAWRSLRRRLTGTDTPILADSAQNMQEFTTLRAAIQAENWLLDGRLAVGGASMGGMTALGIMTRHREGKMRGQFNGVGLFYRARPDAFPAVIPAEPSTAGGIRQYHRAAT